MLTNETLRFLDDNTFQEADPPEVRGKPLEWRRSFNTIDFETGNLEVEYIYSINEIDHFQEIRRSSELGTDATRAPVVTPSARRCLRVKFQVPQEKIRDSIFCTIEKEKGSNLYQLRRTRKAIEVTLTDGFPTEQRGLYATGAYAGLIFQSDFEPGQDSLFIEASVPSDQLEEIVAALKAGTANTLHIGICIQSYSYEVDDALREWYHPRDLFIRGNASQAVLTSIRLLHRKPEEPPTPELEVESDLAQAIITTPPAPAPDYSSLLKGIKAALWSIALLLFARLFK